MGLTNNRDYRNYRVVPTIDLTYKEDGTTHTYRVRELSRPFGSVVVSATSKAEAKEKARQSPHYLDGKLTTEYV